MNQITKYFSHEYLQTAPRMEGICSLDFDQKPYQRICLSDNIEGCINAIKGGIYYIRDDNIIKVYLIEIPINEMLKPSNDLYENYNVYDANFTHEYWYMGNLFLKGELYKVVDWREDYYWLVDEYDRDFFISDILENNNVDYKYIEIVKEYDFFSIFNYYLTDFFKGSDYHTDIRERFPDICEYLEMYDSKHDLAYIVK